MLFVCLAVSVLLLLLVNAIAFSRKGTGAGQASVVSIVAIVPLFLCTMSLVLLLNALALAITGLVCSWLQARPQKFLISSLGVTVAIYALLPVPDLLTLQRLKKENPMESLTARLAYEDRVRKPTSSGGDLALAGANNVESLENLVTQVESGYLGATRTLSLEHLHAGITRQFINSPGFGVGRHFPRADPSLLAQKQLRPEDPIPQPIPYSQVLELAPGPLRAVSESDFLNIHNLNTVDFLNPLGFGYFRDRDHMAGFRPHQFSVDPRTPERWRLSRLELVGILKYEEPVVYLSENLPRMEELSQAATRSLDTFEDAALAKLRRGQDLIVQETPQQMRMLGSIRATKQCLRCHQVERGELLGAFSYQLRAEDKTAK